MEPTRVRKFPDPSFSVCRAFYTFRPLPSPSRTLPSLLPAPVRDALPSLCYHLRRVEKQDVLVFFLARLLQQELLYGGEVLLGARGVSFGRDGAGHREKRMTRLEALGVLIAGSTKARGNALPTPPVTRNSCFQSRPSHHIPMHLLSTFHPTEPRTFAFVGAFYTFPTH